ncbi:MAG: glycoside hydrolase [Phycisphaerae bacterium]|nr:glycoside hydrolase [Phycisphaerae bacterium]
MRIHQSFGMIVIIAISYSVSIPFPRPCHGAHGVYPVRDFGALGDGKTLDTVAINKAVTVCSEAGGGQVRFDPGRYVSGTVHLRDNVTLYFDAGAALIGTSDLKEYQTFAPPSNTPEARFAKSWHSALILGVGVKNVALTGPGVIDGNKVFNPNGEEKMRGPHTLLLGDCRNVAIRDMAICDSANYAVMIEFCEKVEVHNVAITGGWDGIHFRGWSDKPCRDIRITDCRLFTGDDSIAGRYVKGLLINNCIINSSCNGIRIIGPVSDMIVSDCLFYGPGLQPHRTSNRTNALAGIILQPGGWDACDGAVENVLISQVTMTHVAAPISVILKRPGNTADNVTIAGLSATGVNRAAASVESWTDTPCGRVVFRDVSIEYEGGASADLAAIPARKPGVDVRSLPAWGFFAKNAREIVLENVRLNCRSKDLRPVIACEDLDQLVLDSVRFPQFKEIPDPVILKRVNEVHSRDVGMSSSAPDAQ